MKKLFLGVFCALCCLYCAAADFRSVDCKLGEPSSFEECETTLKAMLSSASAERDKFAVLWRLSRICVIRGQEAASKEAKKEFFSRGVSYAREAIKLEPSNPDGYMWHSANVGRGCQLSSIKEQIKAVPVMIGDLTKILEGLGKVNYSAAWQALGEIYHNHPFKSNDDAVNFLRQAVLTIPSGELRLSTYLTYAQWLSSRGWSASKRKSEMEQALKNTSFKGNIDKYAATGGVDTLSYMPAWSTRPLVSMSDSEEAAAVLRHACSLYESAATKSTLDSRDYKELQKLLKSIL